MTRDQIVKASKEASRKVDSPKSGTPASKKHVTRLAEIKAHKIARQKPAPAEHQERRRA
ncbi:hypothetical protein [Bradyrhizobium sp. USDA 4502]